MIKENIQMILLVIILTLLIIYIIITTSYIFEIEASMIISILTLAITTLGWFVVYALGKLQVKNHVSLDKKIDIFNNICILKNNLQHSITKIMNDQNYPIDYEKNLDSQIEKAIDNFNELKRFISNWYFLIPNSNTQMTTLEIRFHTAMDSYGEFVCIDQYMEEDNNTSEKIDAIYEAVKKIDSEIKKTNIELDVTMNSIKNELNIESIKSVI